MFMYFIQSAPWFYYILEKLSCIFPLYYFYATIVILISQH